MLGTILNLFRYTIARYKLLIVAWAVCVALSLGMVCECQNKIEWRQKYEDCINDSKN